jgi:hypothetical protein
LKEIQGMPAGVKIDGIQFSELAIVSRPDHSAVLGRIFTSWSLIEASVSSLLGLMMHADPRASLAVLSTFSSNHNRVQAVRKVGKQMLDASLQQAFDDLMKDVLTYAKERNDIAHNLWGSDAATPDLIYRMPMAAMADFVVKAPTMTTVNTTTIVAEFKAKMKAFTVADLEQIEQQGHDILTRVMNETTKKGYALAVQNAGGSPSATGLVPPA